MPNDYVLSVDLIGGEKLAKALNNSSEFAKKALADALNKTAVDLVDDAMEKAPHKSGRLRSSIPANTHYANSSNLVAKVGTNVEYAKAQEFGRPAKILVPTKKKALFWKGAAHPVRLVKWPGFKGKFYMKQAKEAIKPKMTNYIQEAANKIINKIKS